MALSKSSGIVDLNKFLNDTLQAWAEPGMSDVAPLVTTMSTNGNKAFVHAFFAGYHGVREWLGEKLIKSDKIVEIPGTTQKWEITKEISYEDTRSPVLSNFFNRFQQVAIGAVRHDDEQVADFLSNGTSTNAKYTNYDALPLFSASHVTDKGTANSNLVTSNALSQANIVSSYEVMRNMKNSFDGKLRLMPQYLVVPQALELAALDFVDSERIAVSSAGVSNVLNGRLTVIALPELDETSATTWYLVAGNKGAPFTKYEFEPMKTINITDDDSPERFYKDRYVYGMELRDTFRANPYQLIQRNEQ